MSKVIIKKTIDVTGVELAPGDPSVCLGKGEESFLYGSGKNALPACYLRGEKAH